MTLLSKKCIIKGFCGVLVVVLLVRISMLKTHPMPKDTAQKASFHGKQILSTTLSTDYRNLNSSRSDVSRLYVTSRNAQLKEIIHYRVMPEIQVSEGEKKSFHFLLKEGIIEPASEKVTTDTKVILWYTPTRYHPVLYKLHPLRGCPDAPCRVTTNRYFYNQSEALVFTAQRLERIPPAKLKNQVWILHNHESPQWVNAYTPLYTSPWKSRFNWTLDYRLDADINDPYAVFKLTDGHYETRHVPPSKNYKKILSSKNGTIAWMVSHCKSHSQRLEYVKELSKYVNVDIYGMCGKYKCPRSKDDECLEYIASKYKFYLSFENAICKDYITEKFFRYFNSDMIVIVRGGGNYTRIAPPDTYINTIDYKSIKELADYINFLNANDEMYLSILRRKDQYESVYEDWPIVRNGNIRYMTYHYDAVPICEVCNRLWKTDKYEKHYKDITEWFDKGLCQRPSDVE